MDLSKTFKGKLAPRLRNIIVYRVFEQAEKEKREIVLPKDLLLSIFDDEKTLGYYVVKFFNVDMQQLLIDIKNENPIFQNPANNKKYHDSFFQLIKLSDRVMHEMRQEQVGTEHIILAFLRYSGKSKHILNFKEILNKNEIEYEKFYEGIISISNHIPDTKSKTESSEENQEAVKEKKQKRTFKKGRKGILKTGRQNANSEKILFDQNLLKDLNAFVLKKKEKIVGRENEINRCIRILCRKKKSNPIIIGNPGVGKTALAEGIASSIVNQSVPEKLKKSVVYEISLGNIVAGTKYRGQFEEKMMNVVEFFMKDNDNLDKIAFIDEIHHLIKAGSSEGAVDASFILKPKLADGSLHCIGTTTYDEYRKFSLADPALARRFRPVFLEEPTPEQAIEILNMVKDEYEKFHNIKISKKVIERCIELTNIYIKDRYFPDKAFDILDEACAQTILENDKGKTTELQESVIEEIVSSITGVPISTVCGSEKEKLSSLEENLTKKVIGQKKAIESICNSIKRSRLGFKDSEKPMGCYLFVGKTGVGKTILSKELSENLFGKDKIIRLDMSEYMEKHSVSKIIGAPPGYVGHDSGGQLTEKVRMKPYSVVLFDEIEKAHPDVVNILLQILDEGRLTDSFGRLTDFKNCIIIMTSNLAASKIDKINNVIGFKKESEITKYEEVERFLKEEAEKHFPPEFINRLDDIVVFNKFSKEDIHKIFELELNKSIERLAKNNYSIEITESMKEHVKENGYSEKFGARPMVRAIVKLIETPLANAYFAGQINNSETIVVDFVDNEIKISNKKG